MKKLVLASKSPRRKKILTDMGLVFDIIPSKEEEKLDNFEFTYPKIENLAYSKAKSICDECDKDTLIISADTVVILDEKILNKPKNKEKAYEMLNALSGREHKVVTAICIFDNSNQNYKIKSVTSYVEFNELTKEMITYYIDKYNPLDKAGAYGIQELPDGWVKNINGSLENIIGICPKSLNTILQEFQ